MKFLMTALLLLASTSSFAEVSPKNAGPCLNVAENMAVKLYNNPDTVHETTIDSVQGDIARSGVVVYTISTGNTEDGYYPYTIAVQQIFVEDGSVQCKIVSAK